MKKLSFNELQLHDAVLESISFFWEQGQLQLSISSWCNDLQQAQTQTINFKGVTEVQIPKKNPWGPSSSINTHQEIEGKYNIEMQSGDVISFIAKEFSHEQNAV